MARLRRLVVRLAPSTARKPPGLGHNNGPPLDLSWSGWIWRRAAAKAWKTPPREVALRRLRRAEQLGLSYRELTSALMDRGRWLGAIVFAPGALDRATPARLRARFAALTNCRVLVCQDSCASDGAGEAAALARLNAQLEDKISALRFVRCAQCRCRCGAPELPQAVRAWLDSGNAAPSEAFMVGGSARDLAAAEDASLALFKRAEDYFTARPA